VLLPTDAGDRAATVPGVDLGRRVVPLPCDGGRRNHQITRKLLEAAGRMLRRRSARGVGMRVEPMCSSRDTPSRSELRFGAIIANSRLPLLRLRQRANNRRFKV
jgi:hypothetical protein